MKTQRATPTSLLIAIAREDIPVEEIDLWPGLHSAIVAGRAKSRAGDSTTVKSRTDNPTSPRGLRLAGAATLLLLALVAAIALAPQGNLLADTLRNLFRPITAEQLPTPSAQDLVTPAGATAVVVEQPPVVPPETYGVTSPEAHPCEQNIVGYGCKLARAETQAGFDALEFPADPPEFAFQDAIADDLGGLSIGYVVIGGGGNLYLSQGLGDEFPEGTGKVPESAIQPVWVGEHRGEYVEGMWVIGGEYEEYTWNECCVARLRWTDGERWFEINKLTAMPQTDYLTREVMIDLAVSLVERP